MKSNFRLEKAKELIEYIENEVKNNAQNIIENINKDNKIFQEKFSYSKLTKVFENFNCEEWIMDKRSKNLIINGIGNIGLVFPGKIEILVYMILKSIKTGNNIFIYEKGDVHNTSKLFIDIVNEAMKKMDYYIEIEHININSVRDVAKNRKLNKIICIEEYDSYIELKKVSKIDVLYNGYGTISFYMDDKNLKSELKNIDDYVYENNMILYFYKNESVESVVEYINNKEKNSCAVIFTKDLDKAYYFIEHVKADKIYINKNPFDNYFLKIEDEEFVEKKEIVIF